MHYPVRRIVSLTAIATLLAIFATSAKAQTFVYTDFSTVSVPGQLTLNGSAAITNGAVPADGKVLRLTNAGPYEAGSAFSTSLVPLTNASFSTAFTFRITGSGGIGDENGAGADGLTFLVQTVSNNVGGAGGGIGYQGVSPSLAIEFDTYNNGYWDQYNGNHVGINLNGNLQSTYQANIGTTMNNGALWYAWVDYNGNTNDLQVRLAQNSLRPTTALLQTNTINLSSLLGQNSAYVGFTSGTGAAWGNHDITSWQFNNTYQPITHVGSVPDASSTLGLLALVLAPIMMYARRRRSA